MIDPNAKPEENERVGLDDAVTRAALALLRSRIAVGDQEMMSALRAYTLESFDRDEALAAIERAQVKLYPTKIYRDFTD